VFSRHFTGIHQGLSPLMLVYQFLFVRERSGAEMMCCGHAWASPELVPGTEFPALGPVLRTSSFLRWLKISVRNAVRCKKTVKMEIYLEMWSKNMVCWTDVPCLLKMNDFTNN